VNSAFFRIVDWFGRGPRLGTVAGFMLTAMTGCFGGPADDGSGTKEELGRSAAGAYLAGSFARAQHDTTVAANYFVAAFGKDPSDVNLLQRAFFALLADGRVRDALALADRVAKANPRSGTANLLLAAEHMREGRTEAALERLAVSHNADQVGMLRPIILAWALAAKGDTEGALKALGQLADRGPLASFRNFHAGSINEMGGKTSDAEAALRALVGAEGSGALRSVEALGTLLERAGRADEAETVYRAYLRRFPDNPVALELLRRAQSKTPAAPFFRNAVDGIAEAFYQAAGVYFAENIRELPETYAHVAVHLRPDFSAARILIAEIKESQNQWPEALDAYKAVAAASPYGWIARLRAALALDRNDKIGEAEGLLRAMIAERPERADAASTLGDIYRGRERWIDAARAYDVAIARLQPATERHWLLYFVRGQSLERAKEWERAEPDFLKALELRPDQPIVLNYLGYSWVDQGLHLARARRMIERAVEQRPQDGAIVDSLGWVLFRLGKYQEAVEQLERAVVLRPGDATINDHLGDALWVVGRQEEAVFQWKRALTLSPEPELVPKIEHKLRDGFAAPTPLAETGS